MNSQSRISEPTFNRPSQDEIALRAHQLWLEEGCPHGHDVDHWIAAERQLTKESLSTLRDPLAQDRVKSAKVTNRPGDLTPASEDVPYSAFNEDAPLATKVEEQIVNPGGPASRRSKTSLEVDTP